MPTEEQRKRMEAVLLAGQLAGLEKLNNNGLLTPEAVLEEVTRLEESHGGLDRLQAIRLKALERQGHIVA